MSELKPCPFCGSTKICTEKSINLNYCDNCSAESNVEHWNTRPIEDALTARIAELEAKNAEQENYIQELLDGDIKFLQAICKSEVDMAKYNELEVEYSKWILYDKIKLAEMIDWASMWEDYTRAAGKYRESKFPELDLDEMFSPLKMKRRIAELEPVTNCHRLGGE